MNTDRKRFDTIVIGKGLIGAAAARHLSRQQAQVAVIGPDEPTDKLTASSEQAVFASHYDAGRVIRCIDIDPNWTQLNIMAASQFAHLEAASRIRFHYPVGCLYASPEPADPYLAQVRQTAAQHHLSVQQFESNALLHEAYPDYHFELPVRGVAEATPAGHINPRALIEAQLAVFQANGGAIFRDTVTVIEPIGNGLEVHTLQGRSYHTEKALVAAGAFTNCFDLLRRKLALTLKSETVILAQVNAAEAARLARLPSLLYELDMPELEGIYLIRPLRYPDGNFYLKMGCNFPTDHIFTTLTQIQAWFVFGDSEVHHTLLRQTLQALMPNLTIERTVTKRCVLTRTVHKRPYIGPVDHNNRLFVAVGGNGYAAMCSDGIGQVAARLVLTRSLPPVFSPDAFQPVFVHP
ncbi:MAG: FAD-binding oxidoreductase [Anaerolineales bacterium]|nr:FAD-binding oxidoreductase [Anaerolineales bacterium]MCA9929772.1 FAD-binding oxidoreductase [Anaerolineales bacterium]